MEAGDVTTDLRPPSNCGHPLPVATGAHCFSVATGGAHPSLHSWHCEWVQRQNHALLAVMRMYCQTLPRALLTPELKSDMLLDGAAAAAATRQAVSPAVRGADPDVVLDTSSVADGPWLGSLVQTNGSQPRCVLARSACSGLCRVVR